MNPQFDLGIDDTAIKEKQALRAEIDALRAQVDVLSDALREIQNISDYAPILKICIAALSNGRAEKK